MIFQDITMTAVDQDESCNLSFFGTVFVDWCKKKKKTVFETTLLDIKQNHLPFHSLPHFKDKKWWKRHVTRKFWLISFEKVPIWYHKRCFNQMTHLWKTKISGLQHKVEIKFESKSISKQRTFRNTNATFLKLAILKAWACSKRSHE